MTRTQSLELVAEAWPRIEAAATGDAFLIEHCQYYLPGQPALTLVVAVAPAQGGGVSLAVSDQVENARQWLARHRLDAETLPALAGCLATPVIRPQQPVRLVPVHIPKPWGQEVWYTGIEQRGQSLVTDGLHSMPLPWLLTLGRQALLEASGGEPNLLKILDPLGEEVFGDLYFELHEEKREVYVVTAIDRAAWPGGRGAIRYGFDQERRRQLGDQGLRAAYLDAVRTYETVRRRIDGMLDDIRRRQGVAPNEPVAADLLKRGLEEIPDGLREQEAAAREVMNAFTHLHPLQTGDVVKVACRTPHALQHGVRTVEFQTPVYERKILNFAQKVLTQDHWDTEEAVAIMNLDNEAAMDLVELDATDEYLLEQIVRFDDFQALRLTLERGANFTLEFGDRYSIAMVIEGEVTAGPHCLGAEEAVLVPRPARGTVLYNNGSGRAICLLSLPADASAFAA